MIQKGELAECVSGLFDGGWFRYYVCDGCQRTVLAIVVKELKEGCPWHTAWIHPSDLGGYIRELSEYDEHIKPLGLPTIGDCRRYVDGVYMSGRSEMWQDQKWLQLEAF